jgi:uncharacterized protein (TIGR00297 family)
MRLHELPVMLLPMALRSRIWAAGAVTAVFTIAAYKLRGVDRSGAFAGAPICFLLYIGAGPGAFLALVSVFALSWIATRIGYRRKQQLGTAEKRNGRQASQVLANLSVAAVCAFLYAFWPNQMLLAGVAAALCEAAADTVSSEVGQIAASSARLITTGEPVPAGTDGGVSLLGSASGIMAAALVSAACTATSVISRKWFLIVVVAAVAGMFADSVIGALFERRRLLNNDAVNFFGTLTAAGIAMLWVKA